MLRNVAKVLSMVLVVSMMLTTLVACNGGSSTALERRGVTRGVWNGNTWTSDYLGLTLTLPSGWVHATDEEIADVLGLGADLIAATQGVEIDTSVMESIGVLYDLMASSPNGASIQVGMERLVFPNSRMTAPEYIEASASELVAMGMEVDFNFPNTRIGSLDWYSYGSMMEFMGMRIYGRYFVNVYDSVARFIILMYTSDTEGVDEMLRLFS